MTKAPYRCFDELVTEFLAEGCGRYRTNTAFMDKVADTYILASGKSGIRRQ